MVFVPQINNQIPKDEDIEFIDAENYRAPEQGAISYEQLVLDQIRRCIQEGSKEMVGGYMQTKVTSRGAVEIYIPDQRAVYIQCIDSLYDVLLSFFDDEMWKAVDRFSLEIKQSKENKIEMLKKKLAFVRDNRIKNMLQIQIESGFIERESMEARALLEEKLDLYRELFQELLLLYSRKRYLIAQAIEA